MNDKKANTKSESNPTVFDTNGFQESLMEHVRSNGGTAAIGGKDFIQGLVKSAMQALLEVEMEEHLGYPKHTPEGRSTGNSRNGTFEPQMVRKNQKSIGNFGEKVISLYARGMTTQEIEEHLAEMYGIEVFPQFVTRATEALEQEIVDWQNRPLDKLYPVVYVDGLRASARADNNKGPVLKKCLYTVLGIDIDGKQEVLGLWIEETEGARFWLNVLNDLKARGVEDVLILCGDGLTGLPSAVESVYPKTDVQLCVVHQIRNATKFVSFKDRKRFCTDMKPIYSSPTIEAAEQALEHFADTWEAQYPASIASWRKNWEMFTTFYRYPVDLRKIIYTTNAIESLNAQIRKNTRNRKVFPNDAALIKLVYLNVRNFTKKWTRRHGWGIVMNQLSIIFPERLTPEVLDEI